MRTSLFALLAGFFVMGFVDVTGIATNYIRQDFGLPHAVANLLPMAVFLWFAVCSVPTGLLMNRYGKKRVVCGSLLLTLVALLVPLAAYTYPTLLLAFALLGISNTALQVSLNPLTATAVQPSLLASVLTWGQFIKAVSAFLGPVIASAAALWTGQWKLIFALYALITLANTLWIARSVPATHETAEASTFGLTFAKGFPYDTSHRHFSHAMAIHPLGLIDWSDGEASQRIIRSTLQRLKDCGPDWWCGYSYSWYANLQARAFNGNEAARALRDFAQCFCLPNTFHVNGDQSGTGKSRFTYRPFTLEGNFAFAAGVQEMLLQSHTGIIRVFPAIPDDWQNVSFHRLRAMGGFLVSAERKAGQLVRLEVFSEQGQPLRIVLPGRDEVLQLTPETGKWVSLIPAS